MFGMRAWTQFDNGQLFPLMNKMEYRLPQITSLTLSALITIRKEEKNNANPFRPYNATRML